jgi:hypothetical protein
MLALASLFFTDASINKQSELIIQYNYHPQEMQYILPCLYAIRKFRILHHRP